MSRKTFTLDKRNGKFLGVCAGIADYTGIDATIIRIVAVVATLAGAAPWTFIAYFVAAWAAKPKPAAKWWGADAEALRSSTYRERTEPREIDRRIAEVDHYVASADSRLAREIDALR